MKTFDEAVEAAFLVTNEEDYNRVFMRQQEFVADIDTNPTINGAVADYSRELILFISAMPDDADGNHDKECRDVMLVVRNYLMSAFQWGLVVGREMEKIDAPAMERMVAAGDDVTI